MAHYVITHTCGHTSRPDITGPHKSREWRIKQLEGQVCWECQKAANQAEAQRDAEAQGLPALVGKSQAQIDYAMVVRDRKLAGLNSAITQMRGQAATGPDLARFDAVAPLVMEYARAKTEARWWLDANTTDTGGMWLFRALLNEVLADRPDLDPRTADAQEVTHGDTH